ncbi:MAG TPA: hypothetical protein PLB25_12960 [Rhodoferax sp.]|nr:hypothetical protein [Rhodoferax sp.]
MKFIPPPNMASPEPQRSNKPIAHQREEDGITQSLEAHLLGVSHLAGAFAAKLGLNEQGDREVVA